eukprot:gnl/Trimastix_PCT/1423.p1 GENE.gnl/Trimastix_PCT/1423~~gnl/Trimastix_PCT/1423.p1  ORF type:complete len:584 (-),score=169.36 gnl/Trimastix_PCT/1423:99-1850(-)
MADAGPGSAMKDETELQARGHKGEGEIEDQAELLQGDPQKKYTLYKRRWLILLCFSLNNICVMLVWISSAPISDLVMEYYEAPPTAVNFLSMIFLALYIPVNFISCWFLDRFGLGIGGIVPSLVNTLGTWIRYVGSHPDRFWVLFAGQAVSGITQSFIQNAPAKIAMEWFGDDERTLATSIASLSMMFGTAIGEFCPPLIVRKMEDFPRLSLILAVLSSVISVMTVAFVRSKPKSPPSAVMAEKTSAPQSNFRKDCKALFTNGSYVSLIIGAGAGMGAFNALASLLEQIVRPAGYSNSEAGTLGGVLIGAGLVTCVIWTVLLEKTRAYKKLLMTFVSLFCLSNVWFLFQVRPGCFVPLLLCVATMGVFSMFILPLELEFAAEITYPVPESTSSGFLLSVGMGVGLVMILIMGEMASPKTGSMFWAQLLLTAVVLISIVPVFFIKPNYKRLALERYKKERQLADLEERKAAGDALNRADDALDNGDLAYACEPPTETSTRATRSVEPAACFSALPAPADPEPATSPAPAPLAPAPQGAPRVRPSAAGEEASMLPPPPASPTFLPPPDDSALEPRRRSLEEARAT